MALRGPVRRSARVNTDFLNRRLIWLKDRAGSPMEEGSMQVNSSGRQLAMAEHLAQTGRGTHYPCVRRHKGIPSASAAPVQSAAEVRYLAFIKTFDITVRANKHRSYCTACSKA